MTKRKERNMRKCKFCNKDFNKRKDAIFCSKQCRESFWIENNKKHSINYQKEYYKKNKDKIKEINNEWKNKNRKRYKELSHEWYLRNKERLAEETKKERKNNPEKYHKLYLKQKGKPDYRKKHNAWKRAYTKRPEIRKKMNIKQNNKMKSRIDLQIARRIRNRINKKIRKYKKEGKIIPFTGTEETLNLNLIVNKLIINFPKDYGENTYHIDHIEPLCSFDLTDEKQLKEAFAPDNHRWLLAEENLAKIKEDKLKMRRLTNEI